MEPLEPNTEIVEEKPEAATKGKGRTWLFAATHGCGTPRPWPVCSLYCCQQDQAANATTPADGR